MSIRLFRHMRKVYPSPVAGKWRLECKCGWRGEIDAVKADGSAVEPKVRDPELQRMFIEHLPPGARRLYVLVDRRPGHNGNWIMPEGVAVDLRSWTQDGKFYRGEVAEFGCDKQPINLPIGEIRTEEGRVFRAE